MLRRSRNNLRLHRKRMNLSYAPEADRQQLNVALEQRSAGRDYHEYFIPGSIKLLLATSPKGKLDRLAIDNERLFKYRFGFTALPSVRSQVVAFQNKYDLLDDEVRWLKHAGHLRTTRTELIVDTNRWMPVFGWLQMIFITLGLMVPALALGFADKFEQWRLTLALVLLGVVWLVSIMALSKMFVMPWQTLKKAGVIDGKRHRAM